MNSRITRRGVLAATAGVAVGSGVITGFPTIWAQNIKDIELRHAGQPVTMLPQIVEQATKDLRFKVTMQPAESSDLLNRFLSSSANIDIGDVSLPYMKYLVGRNILQTIPVAKLRTGTRHCRFSPKASMRMAARHHSRGLRPTLCCMRRMRVAANWRPAPLGF